MGRNGHARLVFGDTGLATVNTQVSDYCVLSYTEFLYDFPLLASFYPKDSEQQSAQGVVSAAANYCLSLLSLFLLPLSFAATELALYLAS